MMNDQHMQAPKKDVCISLAERVPSGEKLILTKHFGAFIEVKNEMKTTTPSLS